MLTVMLHAIGTSSMCMCKTRIALKWCVLQRLSDIVLLQGPAEIPDGFQSDNTSGVIALI
jgi:hypothetical protein